MVSLEKKGLQPTEMGAHGAKKIEALLVEVNCSATKGDLIQSRSLFKTPPRTERRRVS